MTRAVALGETPVKADLEQSINYLVQAADKACLFAIRPRDGTTDNTVPAHQLAVGQSMKICLSNTSEDLWAWVTGSGATGRLIVTG